MALKANGDLYTFAHYGTPSTGGDRIYPTQWTPRTTGVSSITAWGINGYFGGLYLKGGVVSQVFGKGTFTTSTPQNLTGKTITQIYSSDGAYMALTSSGEVWYWFGNNDHSTPGPYNPSAFQLPNTGTVIGLGVWANHPGNYYAGGYAIQASPCP